MKKKHSIILLPSEEISYIHLWKRIDSISKDKDILLYTEEPTNSKENTQPQHLYILSDEEIKEGDWYVLIQYKSKGYQLATQPCKKEEVLLQKKFNCKKIIATTNPNLQNDLIGYASGYHDDKCNKISQDFIQEYIKEYNSGNTIKEVMVEYEDNYEIKNIIKGYEKISTNLKLNLDNTVIISKVEEKSYSKKEVLDIIDSYDQIKWGQSRRIGREEQKEWFDKNYPT